MVRPWPRGRVGRRERGASRRPPARCPAPGKGQGSAGTQERRCPSQASGVRGRTGWTRGLSRGHFPLPGREGAAGCGRGPALQAPPRRGPSTSRPRRPRPCPSKPRPSKPRPTPSGPAPPPGRSCRRSRLFLNLNLRPLWAARAPGCANPGCANVVAGPSGAWGGGGPRGVGARCPRRGAWAVGRGSRDRGLCRRPRGFQTKSWRRGRERGWRAAPGGPAPVQAAGLREGFVVWGPRGGAGRGGVLGPLAPAQPCAQCPPPCPPCSPCPGCPGIGMAAAHSSQHGARP